MDRRWKQLGDLLVNYSAAVKPGERAMIAMGRVETLPPVQAVHGEAHRIYRNLYAQTAESMHRLGRL